MADQIYTYGGNKLLLVDGNYLTKDENCCCGDEIGCISCNTNLIPGNTAIFFSTSCDCEGGGNPTAAGTLSEFTWSNCGDGILGYITQGDIVVEDCGSYIYVQVSFGYQALPPGTPDEFSSGIGYGNAIVCFPRSALQISESGDYSGSLTFDIDVFLDTGGLTGPGTTTTCSGTITLG